MASWEQINFQNRHSPIIEQFIFLHDHIISILILIIVIVSYTILKFFYSKKTLLKQNENHDLEITWTFIPGVILILIAFPSLRLLYLSEETEHSPINLKIMGHQWYWSYEYRDLDKTDFDSFIKPINTENFRLLDTDNHTTLPCKIPVQIFLSSTDVLHAWTIPAIGVKADSAPGRLNIINILPTKSGLFYGQCSEICGTNHRFMPIVLDIRPIFLFKSLIIKTKLFESWKHRTFTSK